MDGRGKHTPVAVVMDDSHYKDDMDSSATAITPTSPPCPPPTHRPTPLSGPTAYCYMLTAIACLNSCNLGYDVGSTGGAALLMKDQMGWKMIEVSCSGGGGSSESGNLWDETR